VVVAFSPLKQILQRHLCGARRTIQPLSAPAFERGLHFVNRGQADGGITDE
jgi:hypothetical protein